MSKVQGLTYLVNTRKILDEEPKKNTSNCATSYLQYTSQKIVPGGAYMKQQHKNTNILKVFFVL